MATCGGSCCTGWAVEGRVVGVVGGEGDGDEDCSDGMSLLVPLPDLPSDRRRSRMVPASPPEERDKVGDGVGVAAG